MLARPLPKGVHANVHVGRMAAFLRAEIHSASSTVGVRKRRAVGFPAQSDVKGSDLIRSSEPIVVCVCADPSLGLLLVGCRVGLDRSDDLTWK